LKSVLQTVKSRMMATLTFKRGIVDPPRKRIVKMTMMSVVVTMICRVSSDSRFRCKLNANDTAPRRPMHAHARAHTHTCMPVWHNGSVVHHMNEVTLH